jgi:magnesium chelatase subunit H
MAGKRAIVVDRTPIRVVILSLDSHLGAAVLAAQADLRRTFPALTLDFHAACDWDRIPGTLDRAIADVGRADIIIASMLFIEEHTRAICRPCWRGAIRAMRWSAACRRPRSFS